MREHYIRLLVDVELNDKQKHVWYRTVEKFLDAEIYSPQEVNYINGLTATRDEFQGDEEFPHVYVIYLNDRLPVEKAEKIVQVWNKIYPRDFQIESSAEYNPCSNDSCEVEIDDAMFEEIRKRASKFLHNRWVEEQIHEGWRYGMSYSRQNCVSPRLRDWDSLNEQYQRQVEMTHEQAVKFFKTYPHLFV